MPDLFVNTRTPAFPGGTAVSGVTVSLHSKVMLATEATDAQGAVFLGNWAVGTCDIHVTLPPGSIPVAGSQQAVPLSVGEPSEVVFDLLVSALAVSAPTGPVLCRCHGYFKDPSGQPISGVSITFSEEQLPQSLAKTVKRAWTGLPAFVAVGRSAPRYVSTSMPCAGAR